MDRQYINNENCCIILTTTTLINLVILNIKLNVVYLNLQFRINQRIIIKNEYMQQLENMT